MFIISGEGIILKLKKGFKKMIEKKKEAWEKKEEKKGKLKKISPSGHLWQGPFYHSCRPVLSRPGPTGPSFNQGMSTDQGYVNNSPHPSSPRGKVITLNALLYIGR